MTKATGGAAEVAPLPLEAIHEGQGARMVRTAAGLRLAASFGDVVGEHRALRRGCGVADRSWRSRLDVLGEDRARLLNGLVTCDVKDLAPGEGRHGFFTDPRGRVLADAVVVARDDRLSLELPRGLAPRIAEHIRRYVIADRVEVEEVASPAALLVAGPAAAGWIERRAGSPPPREPWEHRRLELAGAAVTAVRHPLWGVPALALWLEAGAAGDVWTALVTGAEAAAPVGYEALETLRVEVGYPEHGRDYAEENFPQETGLEGAVSYTKGCYLGQEVVARIHYRGGVNRQLRGLRFAAGEPPAPGSELIHRGKSVGRATSVAVSPRAGAIGLAVVHQSAAEPGTLLAADGAGAEVAALPLVPAGDGRPQAPER